MRIPLWFTWFTWLTWQKTTTTNTGHAAQLLTLFALLAPGDVILSSKNLYGGSITQFGKTFPSKYVCGISALPILLRANIERTFALVAILA